MLRKLLKHEFKATMRSFLPMYAFMLVLTPIFSLLMRFTADANKDLSFLVAPMSMAGYVVLMIGIFIASYIFIILRYYHTTATSEAYLTFTLPVSTHQIILSKFLIAIIWQIATAVLTVFSVLSMTVISGFWSFSEAFSAIFNLLEASGTIGITGTDILILILTYLIGTAVGTLEFYCAISLGQLVRNHRVLASIGFYLAFYIALQFISLIFLLPVALSDSYAANGFSSTVMLISSAESVLVGIVMYFVTAFILKKHLNVVS